MLKNLSLMRELTWADFKLRYNSSMIGFFWSFLKPLLMLTILYIVFSLLINIKIENYALFLLLGIILWNFFSEATSISMSNILSKKPIIKNIYFPRKILVISSCLNALITLLFNLIIFFLICLVIGFKIYIINILILFLMILFLFIISLGISYILSAFYTKYRDLVHIWEVLVQIGFFITPIVYSASIIPKNYLQFYMLNPLASILTYSKDAIIYNKNPDLFGILFLVLISLVIYIIGLLVFKQRSKYFAEEI